MPRHPFENMPPRVTDLWSYFSKQLGWGDKITSRVSFDFLINARDFSKGRPVLDAGAGHQRYKPFFDECMYLTQEHPDGINFKQMQALAYDFVRPIDERIPVKDGSLACVINTSVLEHVRYPEKFLGEAFRVLCPGGRIYLHVPFSYCEHEQPYDFQRPSRYGLLAWLTSAGFHKISVLPSSNSSYGSSWFFLQAAEQEFLARGNERVFASLSPIIKHCIDTVNRETDDYIDVDTVMPVGWIAIAEKNGDLALPEMSPLDKDGVLHSIRA